VTITPSGGSGTIAESPNPVNNGDPQTLTFVYTADSNAWTAGGTLEVDIPTGWADAQTSTPGLTGYSTVVFSSGGGTVDATNPRKLIVTANGLPGSGTITITYGDNTVAGGFVTVPSAAGSPYQFTTSSDPQLDGPLLLAVQPTVTVN
jgi:hypothetical protein